MGSITGSELVPGEDVFVTWTLWLIVWGLGFLKFFLKKCFKCFFRTVQIYSWVSAPVFRAPRLVMFTAEATVQGVRGDLSI